MEGVLTGEAVGNLLDLGVAVLVAEQNVAWLKGLEGEALVIGGGRVLHSGSLTTTLQSRQLLTKTYLGE